MTDGASTPAGVETGRYGSRVSLKYLCVTNVLTTCSARVHPPVRSPRRSPEYGCNDAVASEDMTNMGKTTRRIGAAAMVASAAFAFTHGTSAAEPAEHQVRYTLTSAGAYDFDLFYLTAEPASMEAFNADAYAYAKREKVSLAPGVPWVFETTMSDPQWAILQVSSTTRGGVGAPNAHCDIAVDGAVVVQHDDPYNVRCQLSKW